ncbi:MAG: hypothetical protein AABW91_00025 [Nanoarchaeota archaeon]
MKLLKSKIGWIFVLVYIVLSTISIIYSRICNVGICDVGYLMLPVIPWVAFFNGGIFVLYGYVISIILNIIAVYLIGYFISFLITKIKTKKKIIK